MFKEIKNQIFSLRKYKNGRTDSKLIGLTTAFAIVAVSVAMTSTAYADVVSAGGSQPTLVTDTTKVESSKAVTFKDDDAPSKKVSVDAVLEKGTAEPTAANSTIGEKAGTDNWTVTSKTDVNYILQEDGSKLKASTEHNTGSGSVSVDYNKEGLAYDTDGKAYKEPVVDKSNISVTDQLGKEDIIKANGKAYELKRSEVLDADKAHYSKTTFNDMELTVSPEDVNTNGGLNYKNLRGRVYLVEELSDGRYGKFVVAEDGVLSNRDAVAKWLNGREYGKEFTKANVNLQPGDSIVVVDTDTYATGSGEAFDEVAKVVRQSETEATPPIDATRRIRSEDIITDSIYHPASSRIDTPTALKEASSDYNLSSAQDKTVQNVSVLKYDTSVKQENKTYELSSSVHDSHDSGAYFYRELNILDHTNKIALNNATLADVLKDINSTTYRIAEFFGKSDSADKALVKEKKAALDSRMNEIAEFIKTNDIKLGILNNEAVFYHTDSSKLDELKAKIESTKTILNGLSTNDSDVDDSSTHGDSGTSSRLNYDSSDPHLLKGVVKLMYHEDSRGSANSASETRTPVSEHRYDLAKLNLKGRVTIDPRGIVANNAIALHDVTTTRDGDSDEYRETRTTTDIIYKHKELITPVRAYKVMHDINSTVNHYYDLKLEPEALKETIETKGSVVTKFVDSNGNEIKPDETLVPETVIKTVKKYETKSDITVISTREEVINNDTNYNAAENITQELNVNGKKYKFNEILPASEKYNNTAEAKGLVKEGITTVVYQYDEIVAADPTKPHEGQTELPRPEDKIPNDPLNRSYKDLGLAKEVKRDITYVYENGPKAGQEASATVEQNARFTRTAEINARTGEVSYTSEWSAQQTLDAITSPAKDKYKADKSEVEALNVTNESENSEVTVRYSENPDIIEHDEAKDKKGSVVVKFLDNNGHLLKEETVKDNVVVERATTKVYADRDAETTFTPTNETYSTVGRKVDTFELNGNKYTFNDILEPTDEFSNTDKETGKVTEGVTTVIYMYDLVLKVDPNKPSEGQTESPKSGDKVPDDPQNRSYKDLGLIKDVARNISYVYADGPKAGQEASAAVEQNAKFTRSAEINTRTAKVTYTSDWNAPKDFFEVVSPVKDKYKVDIEKVDALTVDHNTESSDIVVRYSENPDIIEHDEAKDKKGSVIAKFVDVNGTVLEETVVKDNVIVEKATTKVYADRDAETTYTQTGETYSVQPKESIVADGLTLKLNRIVPVSSELQNSIDENGPVKEGATTVIYEYKLVLPTEAPIEDNNFNGGVNPLDPPANDLPEFDGGVIPNDTPVHEIPEFDGGVNPLDPPTADKPEYAAPIGVVPNEAPVHELPEFNGGVVPLDPPVLEIPEFNGDVVPLDPPVHELPEFNGGVVPNEAPVHEIPEFKGGVVPNEAPAQEVPELKIEEKQIVQEVAKPEPKVQSENMLPNTGSSDDSNLAALSLVSFAAAMAMISRLKKEED